MQAEQEIAASGHDGCDPYGTFLASFWKGADSVIGAHSALFATDAQGLFPVFLDNLPPGERQHHTCNACRHFVERYGHLVTIDDEGQTTPVMWGEIGGIYGAGFAVARRLVARAKVTGVFLSPDKVWGQPVTGEWRHMAVVPPERLIYRVNVLKNASQAMAEKREEYAMLQRGLAEFDHQVVGQALRVIGSDALYRCEKVLGPVEWLAELHRARANVESGRRRDNVTWRAVASAPPGFCHVRSTMIGTLLEDIVAGLLFDDIARRFKEKMTPLQYQRPQAPPAAGNIAQAEKVVEALRSAGAFARRFAKLEDIQSLWTLRAPEPRAAAAGGVFAHLTPKGRAPAPELELPPTTMTWEKFARAVLPDAEEIEFFVPAHVTSYLALVTSVDPQAPPIMQWDSEERRNPVNWYVYPGGSPPAAWNLRPETWAPVTAITQLPFMWYGADKFSHHGAGVVFILQGCRDMDPRGGSALFPEVLKAEYRAVRSTIEAHSRSLTIAGKDEASACGIDLRKGLSWNHRFRVTLKESRMPYRLDRWD